MVKNTGSKSDEAFKAVSFSPAMLRGGAVHVRLQGNQHVIIAYLY